MPPSRVGAKLVPGLLAERTSFEDLQKLELARLARAQHRDPGEGRPTKRERRDLDRFTRVALQPSTSAPDRGVTIRTICRRSDATVRLPPSCYPWQLRCPAPFLSGQADALQLRSGPALASSVIDHPELLQVRRSDGHWQGRAYRVLQFDHTLSVIERARLEALGLMLLDPLRPHAWVVSAPIGTDLAPLRAIGLTGVLLFKAAHKIDPPLANKFEANDPKALHDVILVPWPNVDAEALGDLLNIPADAHGTLHARVDRTALLRMVGHAGVQWAGIEPEEGKPESLRGRTYHRVHGIGPGVIGSPGLDGSGVTVVVNDDGFVGPHIDLKGRTSQDDVLGDLTGTHGDMCAGIVGGAGNIDPTTVGMAPGADLIIRQYQGDLPDTETLHQLSGAVIFSSSYSDGCNAGYTETTQRVDQEVVDNPSILQVFSAGNEGQRNTADDIGTTGPDYEYGWGTVNATRAYEQIVSEQWVTGTVDQGGTATHTLQVPPDLAEVRTMLYWMDPAGPLFAATSLVNDLDLVASDPLATTHLPWALSIAPDPVQLAAGAFKDEDHLNNVEQVHAVAPEPGTWTFTVSGFDVPDGPQDYFLVHTFIARPAGGPSVGAAST
ncbi:MAG: S8 family serine peptidase [Flavobacteriales bacterium]|nr:S8 family serine peptidase [Flavobacteriales bacterium]